MFATKFTKTTNPKGDDYRGAPAVQYSTRPGQTTDGQTDGDTPDISIQLRLGWRQVARVHKWTEVAGPVDGWGRTEIFFKKGKLVIFQKWSFGGKSVSLSYREPGDEFVGSPSTERTKKPRRTRAKANGARATRCLGSFFSRPLRFGSFGFARCVEGGREARSGTRAVWLAVTCLPRVKQLFFPRDNIYFFV